MKEASSTMLLSIPIDDTTLPPPAGHQKKKGFFMVKSLRNVKRFSEELSLGDSVDRIRKDKSLSKKSAVMPSKTGYSDIKTSSKMQNFHLS